MAVILIVDDEPIIRGFICELLEEENQVLSARNGQEALLIAESVSLDLIITDLEMPIMNGQEMVKALRSQTKFAKLPIIAMSSRFFIPADQVAMLNTGVDCCLSKPINISLLQKIVRNLLKEKLEYLSLDVLQNQITNLAFVVEKQHNMKFKLA